MYVVLETYDRAQHGQYKIHPRTFSAQLTYNGHVSVLYIEAPASTVDYCFLYPFCCGNILYGLVYVHVDGTGAPSQSPYL